MQKCEAARSRRSPKSEPNPKPRTGHARIHVSTVHALHCHLLFYLLSLLFFALGLMSKPMLVTLPFVLLLLDYWPLENAECGLLDRSRPSSVSRFTFHASRLSCSEKLPFFALAAASSVVTFIVQRKGGAVSTSLSLGARVANALVSYVRYIGKMFWPNDSRFSTRIRAIGRPGRWSAPRSCCWPFAWP